MSMSQALPTSKIHISPISASLINSSYSCYCLGLYVSLPNPSQPNEFLISELFPWSLAPLRRVDPTHFQTVLSSPSKHPLQPMKSEPPTLTRAPDDQFRKMRD